MEFLNVGSGEFIFILLIAILVIGPQRTVQLARQAGQILGRLKGQLAAFQQQFSEEIRSLEEVKAAVSEPMLDINKEARAINREVAAAARGRPLEASPAPGPDTQPAPLQDTPDESV
ncbi:MAG: hypothetical protein JXD18_00320 [Anaerolineae bacterium]|nr:hypothetical protein [Anaerolineae bacterium]